MTIMQLAALVALLLLAGAVVSHRTTRWMAGRLERNVVLAAAVTTWTLACGLVPFAVFGLAVRREPTGSLGSVESFIFNLIPFVLLVAPLVGYTHGILVTKTTRR